MKRLLRTRVFHVVGDVIGERVFEGCEPFVTHAGALVLNRLDRDMVGGSVVEGCIASGNWTLCEVEWEDGK